MSDTSLPGSQELLPASPPNTPAAQSDGLRQLADAARPLLQDFLNAQQENARHARDHEWRLAELDARTSDKLFQRLFPLIGIAGLFLGALACWAAYVGRWEIATHLVGLLAGFAGGFGLARNEYRRAEAKPTNE